MGEPSPPQSPLIGRIVLVSTAVVKEFGEGLAKNYFVTDEFFFLRKPCEELFFLWKFCNFADKIRKASENGR